MAWQPTWQLLIAFNNNAQDDPALITSIASPPGTLGAVNVWTDVTADWCTQGDTNRGKSHEIDRTQTGTLTFTLDNRAGKYSSWNTSSPYTGKIIPGRPVQLRAVFSSTTYYVFTGVTDVWGMQWSAPSYSTVALLCVDLFAYLNNASMNSTLYPRTVIANGAATYYRMGDPVGSNHVLDSVGTNTSLSLAGTVVLGAASALLNNVGTSVDLANGGSTPAGAIYLPTTAGFTGTAYTFECWYNVTSWAGQTNYLFSQYAVNGGIGGPIIQAQVNSLTGDFQWFHTDGTHTLQVVSNSAIPADGLWHHLAFSTGAPGIYIDGNIVGLTITQNTGPTAVTPIGVHIGTDSRYGALGAVPAWPGKLQEVALYNTALTGGMIANDYFTGAAPPVESSGVRINRTATWMNVPTSNASIDTGKSQVQAETQTLTSTTALSYMQSVEQTEDGLLFMSTAGQLTFRSRDSVFSNVTSTVTFGDGGGAQIPFELNPQVALDTQDVYEQVVLTRNNGNAQTAGSVTGQYGARTYTQSGLLSTNDTEVLDYANWLLNQFATPKQRIRQIVIHPAVDLTGAATTALLGLEIGSVVTVTRSSLPGGGTAFTQVSNVEGINFHLYPDTGDWNVELQLTPLAPGRPWILGTSQLGTDTNIFF